MAGVWGLVFGAIGLATPVEAMGPFEYSIHGPWRIEPSPEGPNRAFFFVEIESHGFLPDDEGAQAWSLSIQAVGLRVLSATTLGTVAAEISDFPLPGLRDGGFENTQVVGQSGGDGVVSAVILSLEKDVVLPHSHPQRVLAIEVEADPLLPGEPCRSAFLRFVDGVQGSGQPVDNKVVLEGQTLRPEAHDFEVLICPEGDLSYRIGGLTDTRVAPGAASVQLHPDVFLSANVGGVQGWSLSVESRGECELIDVTTAGTIGADVSTDPSGLRNSGFEKTEIVDPLANGGREGVVSAVVLSFSLPLTVPAGEHRVLRMTLDCETAERDEGDLVRHALFFPSNYATPPESGQLAGAGQPVKTAMTFDGNTVEPSFENADLFVLVSTPHVGSFIRCDANADGRFDLSDAVWIVNELFRGGSPTLCRDAGDCNGDTLLDLSDTVFSVSYLFLRGSTPPAPFPACGIDPRSTEATCPAGSTSCL